MMRLRHYARRLLRPPSRAANAPGADEGFVERRVNVDGSEYRYRVFVPLDWSNAVAWPVILFLHGAGGYGRDNLGQTAEGLAPALRRHPDRFRALVVFPQIPADRTPGWQGTKARVALAALDQTIEEFRGDQARITLTGLSIGGNGAWYIAYHHPARFAGLLVICGFVAARRGTTYPIQYPSLVPGHTEPSPSVAQQLAHIPTWIFHGDADGTVPVEHSRRMAAALRSLGAPLQYTELAGVDHNAWDDAYTRPEVIDWLQQQHLATPTP